VRFKTGCEPEPTRVLLAATPGLLGEIIKDAAQKEGGIHIVGHLHSLDELPAAVRRASAEVVVCGLPGAALPGVFEELLTEHPRTTVVAIEADGRRSALYRLRPQRTPIGELSPRQLLDVIREAGPCGAI
jgi:DNA-binding NarL/FixJ family response regulator